MIGKDFFKTGFVLRGVDNVNFVTKLQQKQKMKTLSEVMNYIVEKYRQYRPDIDVSDMDKMVIPQCRDFTRKKGKKIERKPREKSQRQLEAEAFERAMTKLAKEERRKMQKEVDRLASEKIDAMNVQPFNLDDFLF